MQKTAVAGTARRQPHRRGCDTKPGKEKLWVLQFGHSSLRNMGIPNSGLEVGQHSLNLWIQPPSRVLCFSWHPLVEEPDGQNSRKQH